MRRKIEKQGNILPCYDTYIKRCGAFEMNKRKPEPRFVTQKAIQTLSARFDWTYMDWMQDWPLEITNEISICDCLNEYKKLSDDDEKFLLMEAILYGLDEETNEIEFKKYGAEVIELLNRDFAIHESTVFYWTLYDHPESEDGFKITPMMRKVWKMNEENAPQQNAADKPSNNELES